MGLDIYLVRVIKKILGLVSSCIHALSKNSKYAIQKIFLITYIWNLYFFYGAIIKPNLKKFTFCKNGYKTRFKRRDFVRDVLKKFVNIYSVQFICTGNHKIFKIGLFAEQYTRSSALYYKTIKKQKLTLWNFSRKNIVMKTKYF